jgi:hypothetical protein
LASFAVKVTVTLEPEATLPADTVMSDCAKEIEPGRTVICGSVLVTLEAFTVAEIVVAVPDTRPVKFAVKVPSRWSVTAPIEPVDVPPERVNATV